MGNTSANRNFHRAALLALAFCGLAEMSLAGAKIDLVTGICSLANRSFDQRVEGFKNSGWGLRNPGMWDSYLPSVIQAVVATSIAPGAGPKDWLTTISRAAQLADILAMSEERRAEAGIRDLNYVVMVSPDDPVAILVVVDESKLAEGRVQCLYAGPIPADVASFVDRMRISPLPKNRDEFIEHYSIQNTNTVNGKPHSSSQLIAILTEKSSTYLGGPPISEVVVSIVAQSGTP